MQRYFIEVAYKGTNYSGFQAQHNANSIQSEVEKALKIYFKQPIILTCASRTDAGVHACQNYFHFDIVSLSFEKDVLYSLNSILPRDIVINSVKMVRESVHCRFDAIEREYKYFVYQAKNPFLADRAYYYPYKLDITKLQQVADQILNHEDFTTFSKRKTQVQHFRCHINSSVWKVEDASLVYAVSANRFLRGMVRGLVGTMLKAGTGKITIDQFISVVESRDCINADFSAPAHGLFLTQIRYSPDIFISD